MKTHTDPKVDYAFKHVFGREQSKAALISLLNAVLQPPPGEGIVNLELLNPFNDKESLDDLPRRSTSWRRHWIAGFSSCGMVSGSTPMQCPTR